MKPPSSLGDGQRTQCLNRNQEGKISMTDKTVPKMTDASSGSQVGRLKLRIGVLAGLWAGLWSFTGSWSAAGNQTNAKRSDVPMTRPEECLAVVDGIGLKSCFGRLPNGHILNFSQGKFRAS